MTPYSLVRHYNVLHPPGYPMRAAVFRTVTRVRTKQQSRVELDSRSAILSKPNSLCRVFASVARLDSAGMHAPQETECVGDDDVFV